jgi:hypothetical protein
MRHLFVLMLLLVSAACTQREDTPVAVVQQLFADHFKSDMAFTPASIERKRNWLTPGLKAQIDTYFARPSVPDEVPVIDGDPFTNAQDYPSGFTVGEATSQAESATVPVAMTIGSERWTVKVQLVRQSSAWLVDDLVYDDGTTFRALLKAQP